MEEDLRGYERDLQTLGVYNTPSWDGDGSTGSLGSRDDELPQSAVGESSNDGPTPLAGRADYEETDTYDWGQEKPAKRRRPPGDRSRLAESAGLRWERGDKSLGAVGMGDDDYTGEEEGRRDHCRNGQTRQERSGDRGRVPNGLHADVQRGPSLTECADDQEEPNQPKVGGLLGRDGDREDLVRNGGMG